MTNVAEAKLRVKEIALATMAMITDYDCWKVEEEPVSGNRHRSLWPTPSGEKVLGCNPTHPDRAELAGTFRSDTALVTDRKLWPPRRLKVEADFRTFHVATALRAVPFS
jgi:5'-methylthioadenosine phosphorylase